MIQLSRTQHVAASLFLVFSSAAVLAQAPTPAPTTAPPSPPHLAGSIAGHPIWPAPSPQTSLVPEAILAAVYSVISGPQGQPRDWDRMRSLFIPDARLIPTVPGDAGHTDAVVLTVDGYIARASSRMATMGFYETSVHNVTEQYGNIVQVWSTYESRHAPTDAKPFARGINSFQILKDGDRYWIVNIFWDAETPTHPIPAQYLPTTPH